MSASAEPSRAAVEDEVRRSSGEDSRRAPPGVLVALLAVFHKDLLAEWRARSRAAALVCFAFLVLLLFSFAVGPDTSVLRAHAAGYLWLAVLLSSTLLLSRSFQLEIESDALERVLLLPVPAAVVFYGKALANAVQVTAVGLVAMPVTLALCDATVTEPGGWLGLALILGAAGLAAPGTLYAALTARLRGQAVLLPLLLFPLVVPALVASVKATSLVLAGDPMGQLPSWIMLLVSFDLVYWSLCGVLAGRVLEA